MSLHLLSTIITESAEISVCMRQGENQYWMLMMFRPPRSSTLNTDMIRTWKSLLGLWNTSGSHCLKHTVQSTIRRLKICHAEKQHIHK